MKLGICRKCKLVEHCEIIKEHCGFCEAHGIRSMTMRVYACESYKKADVVKEFLCHTCKRYPCEMSETGDNEIIGCNRYIKRS